MNNIPGSNEVKVEFVSVGIPREPEDFVREAAKVGHPRFLPYSCSSPIDELIKDNLFPDERNTETIRVKFFNRWLERAKEINKSANTVHDDMADYAKTVLAGKRLQLMGEILQSLGYPDSKLHQVWFQVGWVDERLEGFYEPATTSDSVFRSVVEDISRFAEGYNEKSKSFW